MSRRSTRRSSGCGAPARRRRPSRAGASATRRAPWTAISCRCCRRSPRPTMPPGARGRRNDRAPRRSEGAAVSASSELDREAMQRALGLAERGLASTDPNPRVGCVITQGERIVGEGWHERAGEAHAEVKALEAAGAQAAGATVYVTLEPCSHHGRTALGTGESRWITGEAAREDVQQWRARSSAILTGIGTVLADDPMLDVRAPVEAAGQPGTAAESPRQPLRVVLDSHLRTPPGARLLTGGGEVMVLTAQSSLKDVQSGMRLTARGVRIETVPEVNGRLSLGAALDRLGELEINELQVEAGPTVAGELVRHSLADEL